MWHICEALCARGALCLDARSVLDERVQSPRTAVLHEPEGLEAADGDHGEQHNGCATKNSPQRTASDVACRARGWVGRAHKNTEKSVLAPPHPTRVCISPAPLRVGWTHRSARRTRHPPPRTWASRTPSPSSWATRTLRGQAAPGRVSVHGRGPVSLQDMLAPDPTQYPTLGPPCLRAPRQKRVPKPAIRVCVHAERRHGTRRGLSAHRSGSKRSSPPVQRSGCPPTPAPARRPPPHWRPCWPPGEG